MVRVRSSTMSKSPRILSPGISPNFSKSYQMQCSINCLSIDREYILGFRWDCKCSPQVYRKLVKVSFNTQSSKPWKNRWWLFLLFWINLSCWLSFLTGVERLQHCTCDLNIVVKIVCAPTVIHIGVKIRSCPRKYWFSSIKGCLIWTKWAL